MLTVDAAALGGYRFISEITGLDTVSLGATKRGGINKYTFGGNIHKIEVYETPLTDEELIEETKKTAYPELQQIFHKNDGTGANYYRIPALFDTEKRYSDQRGRRKVWRYARFTE